MEELIILHCAATAPAVEEPTVKKIAKNVKVGDTELTLGLALSLRLFMSKSFLTLLSGLRIATNFA